MRGLIAALILVAGGLLVTGPPPAAFAGETSPLPLALPIDCRPGFTCWVLNHFDLDPGPGSQDYRCGRMTHDGHNGTGFALANMARLDGNVAVRAAAGGVVAGVRDGMADVSVRTTGMHAVKGRECGNGVKIDHGDGWETQYCHLKRGSVAVEPGEPVSTGRLLGFVGLSGGTDHPHLFVSVSLNGEKVDPFRGIDGGPRCGPGNVPLWDEATRRMLRDEAPILLDIGFATHVLTAEEAESGRARQATAGIDARTLLLWARVAGIEPGDILRFVITGPNGERLLADAGRATKFMMVQFQHAGRHRKVDAWAAGVYTGLVILQREGRLTRMREISIRLAGAQ